MKRETLGVRIVRGDTHNVRAAARSQGGVLRDFGSALGERLVLHNLTNDLALAVAAHASFHKHLQARWKRSVRLTDRIV